MKKTSLSKIPRLHQTCFS